MKSLYAFSRYCEKYCEIPLTPPLPRFAKMEEDADLLQACVEDLQCIIDKDGDGDISREEFVKNAANCKFITNLLEK